ncbi:hypothetical protein OG21DRAFT_1519662 [Imleria badia]|nr:hypothetical protein OG21DRAFT_1519662 [Imleria badia]
MSTSLAVDLESLYLNNCLSLVIVTAVTYDYLLTFSIEIEHIWVSELLKDTQHNINKIIEETMDLGLHHVPSRPLWGLACSHACVILWIVADWTDRTGLQAGTTFVPGPLWICKALFYVAQWMTTIFTISSDLVMIFRVYALYGRSRIILGVLLFIYIGELVTNVIASGIYSTPGSAIIMLPSAPDPSVCIVQYPSWDWGRYSAVPVVVLQGVMCLLAIYQCLRQSLHLHNTTRRWHLNKYVKLVVQQGFLYFVMNFLHAMITQGLFSISIGQTPGLVLSSTLDLLMFALNPRFILSIRELYAHTVHGEGIDVGFGTLSRHGLGTFTNLGTLPRFADVTVGSGEGLDEIEEVPMGEMRRKRYIDGL